MSPAMIDLAKQLKVEVARMCGVSNTATSRFFWDSGAGAIFGQFLVFLYHFHPTCDLYYFCWTCT
jgi:hypothetical protein